MPEPFTDERPLDPGDVLMVERSMRDKRDKPYVWRFFLVVTHHNWYEDVVYGWVVGATGQLKDIPYTLITLDARNRIQYLPPEEWPDGVHQYRMAMILKGQIPEIV